MYDIAIVGDGVAGLSAAVNGRARNKRVIIIGRGIEQSAIYKAEKVNNYIGMYGVSGKEMLESFFKHAEDMGAEFKQGRVQQIFNMGDSFALNVENDIIEARAVIIATGKSKAKSFEGEDRLVGKGVSYCATCDGMLYKNMPVVVIGEIKEAEEDARFLAEICSKVYYVSKYGAVDIKNVEVISGKVEEIVGADTVSGVKINGEVINCSCVFIIKESIPLTTLISELELENGHIKINRNCETNIERVFACGDVTGGFYQVAKAVGEGLVAGLNASKAK